MSDTADGSYDIVYSFLFKNGTRTVFEVRLDRATLSLLAPAPEAPPDWCALGFHQCPDCPLEPTASPQCPAAASLTGVIAAFRDSISYQEVRVTVATEERTYYKETSLQEGLSALIGLIMASSGCPVMDHLKPMVRFHLPFATLLETVYRMTSLHLVAGYLRERGGGGPLEGIDEIYGRVRRVNTSFAKRLHAAAEKDASVTALVNLNCFAMMVIDADRVLDEIRGSFSAYLE